jgi:signal peptidase I
MSQSPQPAANRRVALFRRFVMVLVFAGVAVIAGWSALLDTFQIPTGSMAPGLRGQHRVCRCLRCGSEVVVGRASTDRDGSGHSRYYRKAFCPLCGAPPASWNDSSERAGDQVTVNKAAYLLRTPKRWEVIVFRLLGTFYIKRLLGLPGEELLIHDGDLYVNGTLGRKSLDETRRMRVLLFAQEHAPAEGWGARWEGASAAMTTLDVDGKRAPHMLTYRNYSLDTQKCEPIRDECAYNGGAHAGSECVHDFLIETDVQVTAGHGGLSLRLCDGHDWVEARLALGTAGALEFFSWPIDRPGEMKKLGDTMCQPGTRFHLEFAFVDRRVTLAIDGNRVLEADLPEAKQRAGVVRPFQVEAHSVCATMQRFRLFRDLHYGQQGINAVRGNAVRLGPDQYFVLGDNSPQSEDSRYWADGGRIEASFLVGPVLWSRPAAQWLP